MQVLPGNSKQMLEALHLAEGSFPFKYLGVSLSTRKITISQCMPLVERIVDRIRSWTSMFLSYAGRLQLIKSVLFEMQTYEAQVFLIPKKVIKLVNGICRNYLWTGSHDTTHRAPIAWETLCKPQTAGGLNIVNYERWNKAALNKLLWAIISKKDKLWIKWIHCHYIKKKDIATMETLKQAKWLVRKMFVAKEWWVNDITKIQTCTQNGKFSIRKTYLHTTPQYPKVHWKIIVMVTGMLPKQKYILWMAMHRRLATVDRLVKWGVQVDQSCTLCGRDIEETHDHLNLRKVLLGVIFAAVVYNIWMERNERRFQQQSKEAKDRAKEIALQVHVAGQKKPKWLPILQPFNSYPTCNP
ncbi:uncharacterized protein LOC107825139 [Nicotiana tabacum]|uniref:Uncharacterized protein LOC107825139 n=1 Tax=Nicotiana tabacum TaxID=4097 RepID=A0A1S4D2F6_TOBAC|nr:PREDICTED: uncharacterized protein LOC107825139 [Nicotiana tabacum]